MPDTVGSALIRRHIGRAFEGLRLKAGLTQDQVAKRVDRARATISRIEDGDERVRFREVDVTAMLDLYGADAKERELLLALTAETRAGSKKSWWHDYTESELPERMRLFIALEDSAETIRQYEPELVPGLLQTRRYALAVMGVPAGYASQEEAGRRVDVRMDRQSVLVRPRAPRLEVILNEAVLRRPIGGVEVMAEQVEHLLQMAQRDNISIRVVPFSVGLHGGAVASAFSLLDFPAGPDGSPLEPALVYVDTPTGAMYLQKPDEVAVYRLVWQDMIERALNEEQSRDLLRDTVKGLNG